MFISLLLSKDHKHNTTAWRMTTKQVTKLATFVAIFSHQIFTHVTITTKWSQFGVLTS